ncbi:hypothetical protein [Roseibium sediminis]|uniref:hypothetical protein n=1 Tax=Roseibium sediminis TaxID=1775174 RepID=UPI00123C9A67|nr:hypothetical protein [Roseibium sediminis]
MVTDARTAKGNLPKPHPDNKVNEDFPRIGESLEQIGAGLDGLATALGEKPDAAHQHTIDDIQGLTAQLQELVESLASHTHRFADLDDVNVAGGYEGQLLQFIAGKIQAVGAKAEYIAQSQIEGLTSNNVHSALVQLVAKFNQLVSELDQLRGGTAPEALDTIIEIASAVGDNQASLVDVLEQIGRRATKAEVIPTYSTVYGGEVIGSADSGKSFSSDISTQADFKIAPVADLPDGWSITVKFAGQSATARLFTASGNFVYRGSVMPTEFAVVGYGEAFRLTKFAGAIYIMVLEHPPRLLVSFSWPGTGAWAAGPTAWTSMPLTTGDGGVNLGLATLAGHVGTVRIAGEYEIKGSFNFHVNTNNAADYVHYGLRLDGGLLCYEHDLIRYGDHISREPVKSEYLMAGRGVDLAFLTSNGIAKYLTHYSTLQLSLKGR